MTEAAPRPDTAGGNGSLESMIRKRSKRRRTPWALGISCVGCAANFVIDAKHKSSGHIAPGSNAAHPRQMHIEYEARHIFPVCGIEKLF